MMLFTSGCHSTCHTAREAFTIQHDVLVNVPVNALLPNLIAKKVITYDEQEIMEAKPVQKERMRYLLDVITRSLRCNDGSKYNGFIKVLEESKDSTVNQLTRTLGEHASYCIIVYGVSVRC